MLLAGCVATILGTGCGSNDVTGPRGSALLTWQAVMLVGGGFWAVDNRLEDFTVIESLIVRIPRLSPDGSLLAFSELDGRDGSVPFEEFIRIIRPDRSERAVLELGQTTPHSLTWSHDGRAIYYNVGGDPFGFVWDINADTAEPFPFLLARDRIAHSPTDPVLAIVRDGNIWLQPTAGGTPENLTGPILDGAIASKPRWSHDGTKLVFIANFGFNDTRNGLYTVLVDGAGLKQIASSVPFPHYSAIFRPDDQALLVHRFGLGIDELVLHHLDGSPSDSVWTLNSRDVPVEFDWQ